VTSRSGTSEWLAEILSPFHEGIVYLIRNHFKRFGCTTRERSWRTRGLRNGTVGNVVREGGLGMVDEGLAALKH